MDSHIPYILSQFEEWGISSNLQSPFDLDKVIVYDSAEEDSNDMECFIFRNKKYITDANGDFLLFKNRDAAKLHVAKLIDAQIQEALSRFQAEGFHILPDIPS
jgi:hypothetical protein